MSKYRITPKKKREDRFKLPVILGLRPLYYIPALYAIAIILLIFWIFFHHGIKNHGTIVTVESIPDRAEVYADGIRMGTTPCSFYLPSGERSIELRKTGFHLLPVKQTVKGRIFLSRFFPLKKTYRLTMENRDLSTLLEIRKRGFASWSLTGRPPQNHYLPHILTRTASDLYRNREMITDLHSDMALGYDSLTTQSLPFAGNNIMVSDLIRGSLVHFGQGSPLTPQALLRLIGKTDKLLHTGNGSVAWWINDLITENSIVHPAGSAWGDYYSGWLKNFPLKPETRFDSSGSRQLRYGGIVFESYPGGTTTLGDPHQNLPVRPPETKALLKQETLEPFYLSSDRVSMALFRQFTEAVPEWSVANRQALENSGLTDQGYLNINEENTGEQPAVYISWFAAQAFCQWFSSTYLEGTNLTATLPTEAEWEYAAERNGTDGLVWDWCSTGYAPWAYVYPGEEYSWSPAAVVRGGCRLNKEGDIKTWTRAGQPKQLCSPLTGFRIVLRKA